MASTTIRLLHLLALLSLLLSLLHSQMAMSQSSSSMEDDQIQEDEEEDEEYVLDSPFSSTHLRSRFLASIKKGKGCHPVKKNVCNGVSANKGMSILYCCKKHCRDILGDRNHCGRCGNKCPMGQRCCSGRCVDLSRDPNNCGKCGRQCKKGKQCGAGYCGYA